MQHQLCWYLVTICPRDGRIGDDTRCDECSHFERDCDGATWCDYEKEAKK